MVASGPASLTARDTDISDKGRMFEEAPNTVTKQLGRGRTLGADARTDRAPVSTTRAW